MGGLLFWICLVLVLALGGVMGGMGAGREFRELILTWAGGIMVALVVIVLGLALMVWQPWLGGLFIVITGLYLVDWMLKS